MRGRRYIKEVRGTVFLDAGHNGVRDSSKQPLKGVGIKLFSVEGQKTPGYLEDGLRVLGEKLVFHTKTNARGEFGFLVREGMYSISLDVDTLPAGKGVMEANRLLDADEIGRVDFAVRDIDSVSLPESPLRIHAGEEFTLNPIVKDRDGNILSARINDLPDTKITPDGGDARGCPVDRIQLARRLELINAHTEIQYLLQALFSRGKLPADYRSHIPIKSGTGAVEKIKRYMERTDAEPTIVETARQYLESAIPELDRTYQSPSGYFTIHYTLTGENAVAARRTYRGNVPGYILRMGLAFDQVKSVTCGARGFREPVLEEGKNTYNVYVYNLKGIYGITYSSQVNSINSGKSRAASTYICLDNSYSSQKGFKKSREDCMKVTAAHEFFHAVQNAYNVDADSWWKEASATWNEDEIYTGINDYVQYLGNYFSAPYKSLDESSYSGVIFAKFLSENYGGYNMIKRIWEIQSSGYNVSIDAIDTAIKESDKAQDIGTAFNRFSAYNVNPGQYYKEGAAWKISAAVQQTYSNYPVAVSIGQLDHLSSDYRLFKSADSLKGKTLLITVDGANRARWGFKLQKRSRTDQQYSITEISSNAAVNRVEFILKNFGEVYDEVYLIPANLEKERNSLAYTYSASIK